MNISKFIKEKSLYLISSVLIFSFINIYIFCSNSFKGNISELLYLDFILICIYIVMFFIDYRKFNIEYGDLIKLIEDKKDIYTEDLPLDTFNQENFKYIIKTKEDRFYNVLKENDQKLNDMEEYISRWVHEIKLPISALSVISENIEDEEINDKLKNEIMKINFLVNSVMYGSRSTASSEDIFIKEENLYDIVKESLRNNAFFLIKNKIEVTISNVNFSIYTDKKWILYILDQLINNAIKYKKENAKLEFLGEETNEFIQLNIKDNGIGIAKEDIDRIFNKGFTGNNGRNTVYKSTGMGLYFSKKVIEKLEHNIEVDSVKGEYTLFKIKFYKISDYLIS